MTGSKNSSRFVFGVCVATACLTVAATGYAGGEPVILLPDEIDWLAVGNAGMEVAVVHGNPNAAGPYSMLIKVPAGMRIPPHSHPEMLRTSIVVAGTFHFAFGDTWDEAALVPFTPGTVWTEPAGANHFGWARDGEVIAMVTAEGPTGRTPAAE